MAAGFKFWLAGWFAIGGVGVGAAQIPIEGVQDRQVYADRVSFRVPAQAGDEDVVLLNAKSAPASVWVKVDQPDYYALQVRRTSTATGTEETRLVRFMVRSSERGDSEWGLPAWTPYPVINSASGDLAGAHLRLIAPKDYPTGLEIPLVAWIENSAGKAVRANGLLKAAGHPAIQLRRGVGSGFLANAHPAGPLHYAGDLAGQRTDKFVNLESNTVWAQVSGTISGEVVWPPNSRVAVAGSMTIPAGSSLTIEAGTIVRLDTGADIVLQGRLVIRGAMEQPVVFAPRARTQPRGGFILRTSAAQLDATGAIFTGSGANVVAVEIHQQSLTSSDFSFDLELVGKPFPRLQLLRSDNELLLLWADTATVLEQADAMTGPWSTVTGAGSPIAVAPAQNRKFYRVRQL